MSYIFYVSPLANNAANMMAIIAIAIAIVIIIAIISSSWPFLLA